VIRPLALAVLPLSLAVSGSAQTNPNLERVVRRADRQGIILLFKLDVQGAEAPRAVGNFTLTDMTTGAAVLLKDSSVVSREACPFPPEYEGSPRDRICLELKALGKLDDTHHYALLTGPVQLDGATVPRTLAVLDPVGGAVLPITTATSRIEATYSVDLSTDTRPEPRVTINGRTVDIKAPEDTPDRPRCYNRGSFSFRCTLRWAASNGDTVRLTLVDGITGQTLPYGTIQPTVVKIEAPKRAEDTRYFDATVLLTRLNGETTGSLSAHTRDFPYLKAPRGRASLALAPHVDVLLNMKTDGSGRISLGPQAQLSLFDAPLPLVEFRVTPRFETDDKFARQNWMYLDAEARFYIPWLYVGNLPVLGGSYNVFLRAGYERGSTGRGSGAVSVERNNPSRGTLGVTGKATWTNRVGPFAGGIEVNTELNRLSIRRNPAFPDLPTAHPLFWSAGATFKVNPNFGISVTRRSGRQPPLFKHLSGFDVGFTVLQ